MVQERKILVPQRAWAILGGVGLCLAVAGGGDLALGLYPFRPGQADWEFAAVANFLNRLPLLGVGLTLMLAAALGRGYRGLAGWAAIGLLLVGVGVAVLGTLFMTSLPLVIGGQAGTQRAVLIRAGVKGAVQIATYSLAFVVVAVYAIRGASRLRPVGS